MSKQTNNNGFELHDGPALVWVQRAAFLVILGLIAVIVWSVSATVDEVAKARGAVKPISPTQRIESLHGGKVELIAAKLGSYVEKGDLLVRFAKTDAKAARDAVVAKLTGNLLEIVRLDALIAERDADFSKWAETYPSLVVREQAALDARLAFLEAERAEVRARMEAKQAEISSIDTRRPELLKEIVVAEEELASIAHLVDRGLALKSRYVELTERAAEFRFQMAELAGRQAIANAQLAELNASLKRIDLDEIAKARARIAEALSQVRALEAEIAALDQRLADIEIHAPIAGFVQSLPDATTGNIIDPGSLVATIVPADGGLRFTGRLTPRDIGFVSLGQTVRVKIDSFDFSRYGVIEGVVEGISPTTTVDERGTAFYEVRVSLAKTFFRQESDGFALLPGMTGEADIITGAKTVFQYAWKPVFTNLDLALSER